MLQGFRLADAFEWVFWQCLDKFENSQGHFLIHSDPPFQVFQSQFVKDQASQELPPVKYFLGAALHPKAEFS